MQLPFWHSELWSNLLSCHLNGDPPSVLKELFHPNLQGQNDDVFIVLFCVVMAFAITGQLLRLGGLAGLFFYFRKKLSGKWGHCPHCCPKDESHDKKEI